jgi:hypothetical protein
MAPATGWAGPFVRSINGHSPTAVSRPVTPIGIGGRHRATLTDCVTLCDGKGPGRTLAEPPLSLPRLGCLRRNARGCFVGFCCVVDKLS